MAAVASLGAVGAMQAFSGRFERNVSSSFKSRANVASVRSAGRLVWRRLGSVRASAEDKPSAVSTVQAAKGVVKDVKGKVEEKVEEPKAEKKAEVPKAEKKAEEPKAEKKVEEPKAEKKVEEPKPVEKAAEPVAKVEAKAEEKATTKKVPPLQKGGTLTGEKAEGKDPSLATLGKAAPVIGGAAKFEDPRWRDGTWDLNQFQVDGKVNWDAVIDAEVVRRQWLEANPESSTNEDPVVFDTSIVPWWAWVQRFHLPEAEKLNGRAAMIGYAAAYIVDSLTGVGLVDQTNNFFGKFLIFVTIAGVLLIRQNKDVATIKQLVEEWTFYDKQWSATWKEGPPRPNSEKKE